MNFLTKWLENLSSKKFWVAIATLIIAVLQLQGGGDTWPVAVLGGIYIVAQGWVDGKKVENEPT